MHFGINKSTRMGTARRTGGGMGMIKISTAMPQAWVTIHGISVKSNLFFESHFGSFIALN